MVRIVDAHLHLSPNVSMQAVDAAKRLDTDLKDSNISRGIVLHLQSQPWSMEEFANAIRQTDRLRGFVNLNPHDDDATRQLRRAVEDLGFIGLKLHPRLQRFDLDETGVYYLVQQAGELGIPVLVDAFPDGDWLMRGFHPLSFARLAKACSKTRIIIAHFGGHYCLDFMMLAKRLPNLWFDLSYSLLYYRGTPTHENLLYCCRSMNFSRIFYGSDYPDRPIDISLKMSKQAFAANHIEDGQLDALLFQNAKEFFGWTDI